MSVVGVLGGEGTSFGLGWLKGMSVDCEAERGGGYGEMNLLVSITGDDRLDLLHCVCVDECVG